MLPIGFMVSKADVRRILVVDGDRNTRAALAELLCEAGYSVMTAGTDREVALALESFQPTVMLSDVRTRGSWLVDEAAAKRDTRRGPLRVLMSAARMPRDVGVPWIKKPIDLDVLLELLRQITGGPG